MPMIYVDFTQTYSDLRSSRSNPLKRENRSSMSHMTTHIDTKSHCIGQTQIWFPVKTKSQIAADFSLFWTENLFLVSIVSSNTLGSGCLLPGGGWEFWTRLFKKITNPSQAFTEKHVSYPRLTTTLWNCSKTVKGLTLITKIRFFCKNLLH